MKTQGTSTALRPGPYADCTPSISLPGGTQFTYDCYVSNRLGNTWTHGTAYYSSRYHKGWIYDGNLPDGGSLKLC
ncbi:hypothetical protein ACLGIH_01095 [Streptomyces sp. HMX87]|uniref:hypothetical protein n=1 Tax=Streptomyces sp. HMX87 TaxID=3390849 RepID=UPI003A848A8B